MTSPPWPFEGHPPRPRFVEGVVVAALALAAYLALGQSGFYAADAEGLVASLARGELHHPLHFLYLPICAAVHAVLGTVGLDVFTSMRAASALGTAGGVLALHRAAALLGAGRAQAIAVAALAAASPAVVFFASVVEVHGVFFGFAGIAWLAFAHATRSRSLAACGALGLATGLAATVHATGHLLVVAMLPMLVATRGSLSFGRSATGATAVLAAHALVAVTLSRLLGPAGLSGQSSFVLWWPFPFANLPYVIWHEWIFAFLPVSVLWVWSVRSERWRPIATSLGLALVPYVVFTAVLARATHEHGAYLEPLVFPAAALSIAGLTRPPAFVAWLAIALGCALFGLLGPNNDIADVEPDTVAELVDYARAHDAFVICEDASELKSIARYAPDVQASGMAAFLAAALRAGVEFDAFCAIFDHTVEQLHRDGRALLITAQAMRAMRDSDWALSRRLASEHLPQRYALEEQGGRGARWLVVRQR